MISEAELEAAARQRAQIPVTDYENHLTDARNLWSAHHDGLAQELEDLAYQVEQTWNTNRGLAEQLGISYEWTGAGMGEKPPLLVEQDSAEKQRQLGLNAFEYELELECWDLWRECVFLQNDRVLRERDLTEVRAANAGFQQRLEADHAEVKVEEQSSVYADPGVRAAVASVINAQEQHSGLGTGADADAERFQVSVASYDAYIQAHERGVGPGNRPDRQMVRGQFASEAEMHGWMREQVGSTFAGHESVQVRVVDTHAEAGRKVPFGAGGAATDVVAELDGWQAGGFRHWRERGLDAANGRVVPEADPFAAIHESEQQVNASLKADNDRLKAENARLSSENAELTETVQNPAWNRDREVVSLRAELDLVTGERDELLREREQRIAADAAEAAAEAECFYPQAGA